MRVNKSRAVSVKSVAAQRDRALLTVREQLRPQSLEARNIIWSILQLQGLKPLKLASPAFQALVTQSPNDEALAPLLRPLVAVVKHLDSQLAELDKEIATLRDHTPLSATGSPPRSWIATSTNSRCNWKVSRRISVSK